jgi:ribosomal-protein-alanine N-acetyltransferase
VERQGSEALGRERIFARYPPRNPASGRVMRKVGMVHEGRIRKHVGMWGHFVDLEICGTLREEYGPGHEEWRVGP